MEQHSRRQKLKNYCNPPERATASLPIHSRDFTTPIPKTNASNNIRANIKQLDNEYKRAVAMMALIRACTKKRPRGIFSYTGHRYDDGRRDLQLSMEEQFLEAVEAINNAVFDNGQANVSVQGDALALKVDHVDLVYIDPPYYSKNSDNEYVRRYHFVEGLARDWQGVEIQECTKTKKFKSYPTPFSTETGAEEAFDELFERYADSVIAVSYSSNCCPIGRPWCRCSLDARSTSM